MLLAKRQSLFLPIKTLFLSHFFNILIFKYFILSQKKGLVIEYFQSSKTPFLKFFYSVSFGRFVVWWLFQYRGYVRVKRVCANPLYQLPRRPRKWSRCDCLPPSFAVNAPAVFVPDKAQPCQTSLFAMLISLCCQHIANVAK